MERVTFVIEFEEGKVPPIKANMEAFGGKVVATYFGDALAEESEDTEEESIMNLPVLVVPRETTVSGVVDIGQCNYVEGWTACRLEALKLGGVPPVIKGIDELAQGWNACREAILLLNNIKEAKSRREEFEEFMRKHTGHPLQRTEFPFTTYENQQYADHITNMAWITWQAARNNK